MLPRATRVLDGRYRIRRLIGRGGMADVFLGDDLVLERTVAIKILHDTLPADSSGLERFRREAMALAAVRSPHVVAIYDIGFESDGVYLVMQHIEGQTIEQEIARTGPMAPARAEAVVTQLLEGLADMHALGLMHRDIKPSNVLLDTDGHVVLVDLGIAYDPKRPPITQTGMIAGTPGYLAPESGMAETGFTSDVYQVGLLTLFLLTAVDFAHRPPRRSYDDLLSMLPSSLAEVARRALAIDPADRYPSAAIMREAVVACAALPPPSQKRTRTSRGRHIPIELEPGMLGPALSSKVLSPQQRSTAELTAAQLIGLLADTSPHCPQPSVPSVGHAVCLPRRIKTTPLEAAQILSVHPVTRPKVLIVDEDPAFCGTLNRMLKGTHETLVVHTGSQAILHIDGGTRVDAILCGLASPMAFHEAVTHVCAEQAAQIIFLTGLLASREARTFVAKAANKSLARPFEIALLKQLIADQLFARGIPLGIVS